MAVELDDLDRRILGLLLSDARVATSQIADQINLSRPAVAERIDHLSLGREVTAFVAARGPRLDAKQWKRFRELMKSDEVLEVHTVAGDDCFLIKVRTDSITSLNTLVQKLTVPPLGLITRTTIVMETHCEKVGGITLGEEEAEA